MIRMISILRNLLRYVLYSVISFVLVNIPCTFKSNMVYAVIVSISVNWTVLHIVTERFLCLLVSYLEVDEIDVLP